MNPQFDRAANLNLPPPVVESGPAQPIKPESLPEYKAETGPNLEHGPLQPAVVLPMPADDVQVMVSKDGLAQIDVSDTTSNIPIIADDADLIEKEWVMKAKEIVEKTKEDPYHQTKEISTVKSDYMKKRYNKAIKVSE